MRDLYREQNLQISDDLKLVFPLFRKNAGRMHSRHAQSAAADSSEKGIDDWVHLEGEEHLPFHLSSSHDTNDDPAAGSSSQEHEEATHDVPDGIHTYVGQLEQHAAPSSGNKLAWKQAFRGSLNPSYFFPLTEYTQEAYLQARNKSKSINDIPHPPPPSHTHPSTGTRSPSSQVSYILSGHA